MKQSTITTHTESQIEALLEAEGDQTDWAQVDAMTEDELEVRIATDEEAGLEWGPFQKGMPAGVGQPKKQVTVRLDQDIIDWFKGQGKGYQTRMNAVLRQFMEHEKKRAG